MTLSIRKATLAELDALLALADVCVQGPKWSRASWEHTLRSSLSEVPARAVLIAATTERLVGFGVVHAVGDVGEIETLGVLASVRRSGVGKRLCEALIMWAKELGLGEVRLEVRSRNQPALALYEQLGFRVQGERRSYYTEPDDDAILMGVALQ